VTRSRPPTAYPVRELRRQDDPPVAPPAGGSGDRI